MRAFYFAWWGMFVSYFAWFAITPLLLEVTASLNLSKRDLWMTSVVSMPLATILRHPLTWMCDRYGPRVILMGLLCLTAIPMTSIGVVEAKFGLTGFTIVRCLGGLFGATFTVTHYWADQMFAEQLVGTARALLSGCWMESGAAQIIMGSVLFPVLRDNVFSGNSDLAWRFALALPPLVAFLTGVAVFFYTDDSPKGNFAELKRARAMKRKSGKKKNKLTVNTNDDDDLANGSSSASSSAGISDFWHSFKNVNTWIIFFQSACIFGVFMTMNNVAPMYFTHQFGQTTEQAAALASVFGFTGFLARFLGGYLSHVGSQVWGFNGRLWVHTLFLLGEGVACFFLSNAQTLPTAVLLLAALSLCLHAALSSSHVILSYVDPPRTSSISALVSTAGGLGGVGFSLAFRELTYSWAFRVMGVTICASSLLSLCVYIRGHGSMLCCKRRTMGDHRTGQDHHGRVLVVPQLSEDGTFHDPSRNTIGGEDDNSYGSDEDTLGPRIVPYYSRGPGLGAFIPSGERRSASLRLGDDGIRPNDAPFRRDAELGGEDMLGVDHISGSVEHEVDSPRALARYRRVAERIEAVSSVPPITTNLDKNNIFGASDVLRYRRDAERGEDSNHGDDGMNERPPSRTELYTNGNDMPYFQSHSQLHEGVVKRGEDSLYDKNADGVEDGRHLSLGNSDTDDEGMLHLNVFQGQVDEGGKDTEMSYKVNVGEAKEIKTLAVKPLPAPKDANTPCTRDHNNYTVGAVYGRLDSPRDMKFHLGQRRLSTAKQRRCRECRGKIATKRTKKTGGIVPSAVTPVFYCLGCEQKFVCSVCWRGFHTKTSDWSQVLSSVYCSDVK
jgi:MFS transporter, NNP family, nitrate/nitrite transporter